MGIEDKQPILTSDHHYPYHVVSQILRENLERAGQDHCYRMPWIAACPHPDQKGSVRLFYMEVDALDTLKTQIESRLEKILVSQS